MLFKMFSWYFLLQDFPEGDKVFLEGLLPQILLNLNKDSPPQNISKTSSRP